MRYFLIAEDMLDELKGYIKAGDTESAMLITNVFIDKVPDKDMLKRNFGGYFCIYQEGVSTPVAIIDRAYFVQVFLKALGNGNFTEGGILSEYLDGGGSD